jgi:beta-glucosidase
MSGEAGSRAKPGLPGHQAEFARAVLDLGKPVVVLLSAGRPLMVPWLFERADAVLACWYLGSEAGHAVADVVTGRWNPSARLPTGRPIDPAFRYSSKYIDMPNEPLFAFGHGLSYTRFAYSNLRATPEKLGKGGTLTVEVDVANEGKVAGEETVLLFVRDPVASVSRPVLELKAMAKAVLNPGERRTVRMTLNCDAFAILDATLAPRLEPGALEIHAGPAARADALLKTTVTLVA